MKTSLDDIRWRCVGFDALTAGELYEVLALRSEVFVVEQSCVFQDMDGADAQAIHLLGVLHGKLVAYARCFDAGLTFPEASVGRIVTQNTLRGTGAGHVLLQKAIACVARHWGPQPIRIGAQARLESFYVGHGFVKNGAPYMEDGIAHIEMLRPA